MSLIDIRQKALELALTQVGIKEVGDNRGPDVEKYLAAVGLGPGHPWCCAFVYWCYREATIRAGAGRQQPLHRTGKCARLWRKAPGFWKSDEPSVGAIFIHLVDPDDPESPGHAGIVTGFTDRTISAVEGNTNAAGSRVGNQVRVNLRRRDAYFRGFIDVGREGPVDLPPTA